MQQAFSIFPWKWLGLFCVLLLAHSFGWVPFVVAWLVGAITTVYALFLYTSMIRQGTNWATAAMILFGTVMGAIVLLSLWVNPNAN
jgi:hypothetical protein